MPIDVTCANCGTMQAVGHEKAGLRLRCRTCSSIVNIPASEGTASERPTSPPSEPSAAERCESAPRNYRPLIYGVVIVCAVAAMLIRWRFSPQESIPAAQVAPSVPPPQPAAVVAQPPVAAPKSIEKNPSEEPSDKVKAVLKQSLVELRRKGESGQFLSLLRSVAAELPELKLSSGQDPATWNKTTLFEYGVYLNAFRLTSPLDVDGDLFICFAVPREVHQWNVVPISGAPLGRHTSQNLSGVEIEGLDFPKTARVVTQQILNGKIRAKQSYLVYFSAAADIPIPFRAAARVQPATPGLERDDLPRPILRQIGLTPLPKPVSAPNSRVLEGHVNYPLQIAWKPDGELISIDPNGDIFVWDRVSSSPKSKTESGIAVRDAAVSTDGRRAVLIDRVSSEIEIWDLEKAQRMGKVPVHDGGSVKVCFAPDGNSFYVAYHKKSSVSSGAVDLVQWSVDPIATVAMRQGDDIGTLRLQITPRGPRLLGYVTPPGLQKGEDRNRAAIAEYPPDLATSPKITDWPEFATTGMCSVQQGARDVVSDAYGSLKLVDPNSEYKSVYGAALPVLLNDACALVDDRYVALATHDGPVHLFDTVEKQICMTWTGHSDAVVRAQVSPDGKTLASGAKDGTIRLWDTSQRSHPELKLRTVVDAHGHELRPIPPGEFAMGSSPEFIHARRYTRIEDHLEHEQPQHRVRISRPLLLASQEVTVQQFRKFADATGYVTTVERNKRGGRHIEDRRQGFVQKPEFTWRNPGYPQADSHPVVHVTWEDAHAYCDWLSKAEHAKYRLPTEAEWEYACAGDSEFQHPFALRWHSFAMCVNCADASIRRSMGARYDVPIPWDDGYAFTAPVGTYWTNRFGLSEMLGNVWELCEDNWTERYDGPQSADAVTTDPLKRGATASVCRGSSFFCNTEDARACRREMLEAHEARSDVGFRIVREVSP